MTSTGLQFALFGLVCSTLVVLPFLPAWREWRRPSDRAALHVPTRYSSEARHFANELREAVTALSGGDELPPSARLEHVENLNEVSDWSRAAGPVVATGPVFLTVPIECFRPVFAAADFKAHGGSTFSALLSTGRIHIGPRSRVIEWAHADKSLRLDGPSVGLRRISSNGIIDLAQGCYFERVHAPVVRFGAAWRGDAGAPQPARELRELAQLPRAQHRSGRLYRVDGHCTIPAGGHYVGSLIVTRTLSIGADTVIEGDVKARQALLLGPRSSVLGAVICEQDIRFLEGAFANGPVSSETEVQLGAGTRMGTARTMTTVSAPIILAESGAMAYGTVWAREAGVVWGMA